MGTLLFLAMSIAMSGPTLSTSCIQVIHSFSPELPIIPDCKFDDKCVYLTLDCNFDKANCRAVFKHA